MIENIVHGMTAAQVFDILNRLIDEHNQMMTALGGGLVDGCFDYNGLVNKPKVNGVELMGEMTQADLEISLDSEVVSGLNSFATRIGNVENTLGGKVSTEDLAAALNNYALTEDIPDMSEYATKQELTSGLAGKVSTTAFTETITQLNTSISSKANAGEVPTTVQWNNLLTQMEAKVTQAGNSATAAANSATTCTNQCGIATQKAQEASQSAQSVSGALGRITALETKVGTAGEKTSITDDLKETRVKSNDILIALKAVPEVYEKVKEITALDVNY